MNPDQIIRSHSFSVEKTTQTSTGELTDVALKRAASSPDIQGSYCDAQSLENFQIVPKNSYHGYIQKGIFDEDQVHQMHHDWGGVITDVLLNTPAMEHKLNSENPRSLNHSEWQVLKEAAQELLIQKKLNPHSPLQFMADALVGKIYNLTGILDLKKILLKTINKISQAEIVFKSYPSDNSIGSGSNHKLTFDALRFRHIFKKRTVSTESSPQIDRALSSSSSSITFIPQEVSEKKQALVTLLQEKLSEIYPLEEKESELQGQWEALRFHDGDTDASEITQIETELSDVRQALAIHTKEKQCIVSDLVDLGVSEEKIQDLHEQNQEEMIDKAESSCGEDNLHEIFSDKLNQIKEKIISLSEGVSVENLSSLADDFSLLEKTMGNKSYEAILLLLSDQLRHSAMHALKQEVKKSFCQQLESLSHSGSEQDIDLRFSIGAAIGKAIGFELLKGRLEFNYHFNIRAHDDNRVRTQHLLTPRVSVTVGDAKLFQGGLSVAYEMKLKSKSLKSLEEFAEVYADDIMTRLAVLVPCASKEIFKASRIFSRVRQQEKMSLALANTELVDRLVHSGILHPGDGLKLTPTRTPNFSFGYHKPEGVSGMEYRADFTTCSGILKGSYSRSNISNTFMKHVGLLSTLLAEPSRLDQYSKNIFSVSYPQLHNDQVELSFFQGKLGHKKLASVESSIREKISSHENPTITTNDKENIVSSLVSDRENIKIAIACLYEEFDHYCAVVNKKDGFNQAKGLHGWSPSVKAQMSVIKHSFEGSRSANGRGQFLKSVFITHAKLVNLYHQTFVSGSRPEKEDAGFSDLLHAMKKDYELPQLYLEQSKHINKQLTLIAEGISSHKTHILQLVVGNQDFIGGSVKPRVTLFSVDHYNNPDMNGEFLSVRMSVGVGIKVDEVIQKVIQEVNGSQFLSAESDSALSLDGVDWHSFMYSAESEIIIDAEWVKHQPVDTSISANDKPAWKLQYVRLLGAGSLGLLSPSLAVPTGPVDATVKMGALSKNIYAQKEWIGSDTTKYIQTKYNGWQAANKISKKAGKSQDEDAWGVFQSAHQKEFKSVYTQLANLDSNISKEVAQRLFDLTDPNRLSVKKLETALANISKNELSFDQVDDFKSYFFSAMQSFKENPQESEYHQANQAMRLFLTLQNVEHEEDAARSYSLRKK